MRRNPLVVLLCLELMLNAANLALVAFARMWGGEAGQVFALIVMVVAACEVTVGLGPDRGDLSPPAADRRRRAAGAARVSRALGSSGDGRHHFRLAGAAVPAGRLDRDRARVQTSSERSAPGWIATAMIFLSFAFAVRDLRAAAEQEPTPPRAHLDAVELRLQRRRRRQAADPRRPPVGVHDPGRLRGLGADPPVLGGLHVLRTVVRALLLLPELLRALDAAAGAGRQLHHADRRVGVRRHASYA